MTLTFDLFELLPFDLFDRDLSPLTLFLYTILGFLDTIWGFLAAILFFLSILPNFKIWTQAKLWRKMSSQSEGCILIIWLTDHMITWGGEWPGSRLYLSYFMLLPGDFVTIFWPLRKRCNFSVWEFFVVGWKLGFFCEGWFSICL